MGNRRAHTYTIRPSIGGPPILTTVVDRNAKTLTFTTASGETLTVDVPTARAMWITIQESVYQQRSLEPDGSMLATAVDRGTGQSTAGRRGSW
ncbi:MAG: hypothetical protein ACRDT4_09675 [Micromonosporaceae bacterium]